MVRTVFEKSAGNLGVSMWEDFHSLRSHLLLCRREKSLYRDNVAKEANEISVLWCTTPLKAAIIPLFISLFSDKEFDKKCYLMCYLYRKHCSKDIYVCRTFLENISYTNEMVLVIDRGHCNSFPIYFSKNSQALKPTQFCEYLFLA